MERLIADGLRAGAVVVPPSTATPLGEGPCIGVTIFNRTGRDLGVGGPGIETDAMLIDGDPLHLRVRSLDRVYLFQTGDSDVRVAYLVEM